MLTEWEDHLARTDRAAAELANDFKSAMRYARTHDQQRQVGEVLKTAIQNLEHQREQWEIRMTAMGGRLGMGTDNTYYLRQSPDGAYLGKSDEWTEKLFAAKFVSLDAARHNIHRLESYDIRADVAGVSDDHGHWYSRAEVLA